MKGVVKVLDDIEQFSNVRIKENSHACIRTYNPIVPLVYSDYRHDDRFQLNHVKVIDVEIKRSMERKSQEKKVYSLLNGELHRCFNQAVPRSGFFIDVHGEHAFEICEGIVSYADSVDRRKYGVADGAAMTAGGATATTVATTQVAAHAADYAAVTYLNELGLSSAITTEAAAGSTIFLGAIGGLFAGGVLLGLGTYKLVKWLRDNDRKLAKDFHKFNVSAADMIATMPREDFQDTLYRTHDVYQDLLLDHSPIANEFTDPSGGVFLTPGKR